MCKHCEELTEEIKLLRKSYEGIKGSHNIWKPLGDKTYEDLTGKKFGRLTAVKAVGRNNQGRVLWLFKCDCRNYYIGNGSEIKCRKGNISCGCLHKEFQKGRRENLTGKVFGQWTVIKDNGEKKCLCRCSCGTVREVDRGNLRGKISTSCGCKKKEEAHKRLMKDLTGKVFGRLTVLGLAGRDDINKKLLWKVRCSCGTEFIIAGNLLTQNKTCSCGCLARDLTKERCTKPMIGKTFGRLTVIEEAYRKKGKGVYYKCSCSCVNTVIVQGAMLRSGNTKSCSCLAREKIRERHFDDLRGRRFGKLTVVDLAPKKKGHSTRYICKCDCGGVIETTRDCLVNSETMSCGCIKSKGEWKVAEILNENNILFEKQKTYDDLRNKTHGVLRYDFYVSEGNYIIEYDGEQHFMHTNLGWNNEEHFKKVQERDKIKNEYCKKKGIILIRIPYTHFEDLCIYDLRPETSRFIIN